VFADEAVEQLQKQGIKAWLSIPIVIEQGIPMQFAQLWIT
jgi:hypothetical protein